MTTTTGRLLLTIFLLSLTGILVAQSPDGKLPTQKKLESSLHNSRFILLGEGDHTVSQFDVYKDSLLLNILEDGKPTVLIFESGICDLFCRTLSKTELPVSKCIYPVWNTVENQGLFSYLHSAPALPVQGIDLQPMSYLYSRLADSLLKRQHLCSDFYQTDSLLVSLSLKKQRLTLNHADLEFPKQQLIDYYKGLISRLESGATLTGLNPANSLLFIRTLYNRMNLCLEIPITDPVSLVNFRDSLMFENFSWLVNHNPPETRFVFWGHNNHVSKSNIQYPRFKFMGNYLQQAYPGEILAIGLMYAFKDHGLTSRLSQNRTVRRVFRGRPENSLLLFSGEPDPDAEATPFKGLFDYVILYKKVTKATPTVNH